MKKFLLALLLLSSLIYADKDDERKRKRDRPEKSRIERIERKKDFQKGTQRTPTFLKPQKQERQKEIKDQIQKIRERPRKQQDFKEFSRKAKEDFRPKRKHVEDRVRHRRPESKYWFKDGWFDRHRHNRFYGHHYNWWQRPYWDNVVYFLPYGWTTPIYYDWGGYPTIINNYVTETTIGSPPLQEEWLPLGVFAVGRNEEDAAYSNFIVQLAINATGEIAGTFYNSALDQTYTIGGQVDSQTQQVTFRITEEQNSPWMISGLYNLTQDVAPVQFYFSNGTTQTWTFVRLEEQS